LLGCETTAAEIEIEIDPILQDIRQLNSGRIVDY